eukprot:TRINITY_DN732_c0_g1_i1.p1 TRINITY_DN732_c0_g1~~TRINITY_DN732_c0_g1_i1.p1  ORF type:complete len:334 (+),score=122.14 TRINITY_DN732_c0_g1_i1:102-1103(+)
MSGMACPKCGRRLPKSRLEKHIGACTAQPEAEAPEAHDGAMPALRSFVHDGMEWQIGMRVRTTCALASVIKKEYPAGAKGVVFKIVESGVMKVLLDNPGHDFVTVMAEPSDVMAEAHYLPPKSVVRCLPMSMEAADGETLQLPHREQGVVLSHNAAAGKYIVSFKRLRCTAAVPAFLVMPEWDADGNDSGFLGRLLSKAKSPFSKRPGGVRSPQDMELGRQQSLTLSDHFSSGSMSSLTFASFDETLESTHHVRNLSKEPTYSNLSCSPSSPSRCGVRAPLPPDSPSRSLSWCDTVEGHDLESFCIPLAAAAAAGPERRDELAETVPCAQGRL